MPEGARPRRRRRRLLRHRIHMYAYASVSFALMMMGFVFSGFAIFKRESEISKIWLAGPTTIAVGLVLCGKVIIDCRPREPAADEDEVYGNDAEIVAVAHPLPPQREKEMAAKSETKLVQNTVKNNSLIIENFALGKKESRNEREPLHLRSHASDLDSEIWNLRDDCSSAVSTCEHHHLQYQLHNPSLCLYNPSARDESENVDRMSCRLCRADYYHLHSYSTDAETVPTLSCHSQTMHSSAACSPLGSDHREMVFPQLAQSVTPSSRHSRCLDDEEQMESNSSLYQGETFLLNDKQYFI